MKTIIVTLTVPDDCDVSVHTVPAITTAPAISTRPDAAQCACRSDADRRDWFADQARRERLARRKGTLLEGRDDA
jgi:hypothetical protein